MIKNLEIKNFENHEHTILDFSNGFNLICGPSNSGKSSILRALQVVLYNQWNPRSLRLGEKKCTIILTTERGTVKVERGNQINQWTINPVNGPPQFFNKPGIQVIPEVADIVGIRFVKLGNFLIRPNIMDQLEGHFMLSSLEGEDVSGSTRAQVIDEISGLAGMEELVKKISLDNIRNTKEIKRIEVDLKELEKSKHDSSLIEKEQKIVDQSTKLIELAKENLNIRAEVINIKHNIDSIVCDINTNKSKLSTYPDLDSVSEKIKNAIEIVELLTEANNILESHFKTFSELKNNRLCMDKMPDILKAESYLLSASELFIKINTIKELFKGYNDIKNQNERDKTIFKKMVNMDSIDNLLMNIEEKSISSQNALSLLNKHSSNSNDLKQIIQKVKSIDVDIDKVETDLKDIILSIELCPICLKPVHEGCDAYHREEKPIVRRAKKS